MVNLSVPYARPNFALQTLVAEIKAVWGVPARAPEFVTGYKSATNFTGHNADNNGIVHAVDLFFTNGTNWTEARGWEAAEWLRTVEGPRGAIPGVPDRVAYIIYRDKIAGHHNGWVWGGSGYGHWDHIHVSTCDMFWGDPAPKPAGDYDTRAPWGFGSSITTQGTTTPIVEEDDMPYSEADLRRIIADVTQPMHDTTRVYLKDRVHESGTRVIDGVQKMHDTTRVYLKDRIKEASPAELAVQINAAGIAAEVQAELVKLLGGKK